MRRQKQWKGVFFLRLVLTSHVCLCVLEASAVLAKVEAGITHVPFAQVSASGPGANAETGASWKYTGASAGAYAGEARAGPFAARARVKFRVGIRNGVPEVDLGPFSCFLVR